MLRVGLWSEWATFIAVLLTTMVVDHLLYLRDTNRESFRQSLHRSLLWIAVGVGFSAWIAFERGLDTSVTYLTAYLLEKSLSVDNLFVFLLIFRHFGVSGPQQHRVLFWGVLGAVVLRAMFIVLGTELLTRFHWAFYVFGAFLLLSGLRLLRGNDKAVDPSGSWVLRLARRYLRTSPSFIESRFFTRIDGVLHATPLFLVLLVVEISDLVFAVDSVPAVLGITIDIYVVYTSNIMAILGLRALYFLLAGVMSRFHKLDWALSAVLAFIGVKMISHEWMQVPHWLSLAIIAGLLCFGIGASLVLPAPDAATTPPSKRDPSDRS